jgi:hypothetical protein
MNLKELSKDFPAPGPIPEMLLKLAQYDDANDGLLSCDFELTATGNDDLLAGFRGNPEVTKHFWIFGLDGMHSLYGFWFYEGHTIADAPIVYLNGEGFGNTVLANTTEEFIALLTVGQEAVGLIDSWGHSKPPCHGIENFRAWAKTELGIEPPKDPLEIVERAKRSHPDLDEWIDRVLI